MSVAASCVEVNVISMVRGYRFAKLLTILNPNCVALSGLEIFSTVTQGVARRFALPWAIICRASSPFESASIRVHRWLDFYGVFTPLFAAAEESIFKVMQYEH